MEKQNIPQADYLDIIYTNRNKKYGSYELRRNYGRRMKMAMFSILAATAILSAFSFVRPKAPVNNDLAMVKEREVKTTNLIIEPPKPPAEAQAAPKVKPTVANPTLVVVKDPLVKDPPKTQDDLKGKDIGKIDATGDPTGTVVAITTDTTGDGTAPVRTVTPPPAEPVVVAEVMPEFPGNMGDYMRRTIRYPAYARDNGIEGKVIVQFIVNEDGDISGAKVARGIGGGCNEEALRVVNAMPKWKPGMQNGHPVKVYYTLPIRFQLN